jgi:hypothetical protein
MTTTRLSRPGPAIAAGLAFLAGSAAVGLASPAAAQTIGYADAISILAKSCGNDILKHCKGVNLGGGRIEACIEQKPGVSAGCKTDLVQVQGLLAARAAAQAAVSDICNRDAQQFCKKTKPGKGNILNCLLKAAPSVSANCNAAIDAAGYR